METKRTKKPATVDSPVVRAVALAEATLKALIALHGRGNVHGELCPDSVHVENEGVGNSCVMLKTVETMTCSLDASAWFSLYRAPEQRGGEVATARSDLYALGVMTFEWASGRAPWTEEDPVELLRVTMEEPLPELTGEAAALHPWVQRMTEKDPALRFADARQALRELRRALAARPASPRPRRRWGLAFGAAVVTLLAVTTSAGAMAWSSMHPEAVRGSALAGHPTMAAVLAAPVSPERGPAVSMPARSAYTGGASLAGLGPDLPPPPAGALLRASSKQRSSSGALLRSSSRSSRRGASAFLRPSRGQPQTAEGSVLMASSAPSNQDPGAFLVREAPPHPGTVSSAAVPGANPAEGAGLFLRPSVSQLKDPFLSSSSPQSLDVSVTEAWNMLQTGISSLGWTKSGR